MTPSLLVGLALTVGAPAPKDAPKPTPKLEGDWVVESFEPKEGGPPDNGPGSITMTIAADRLLIKEPRREKPEEAVYTVDLTKKPATIDIRPGRAGGPGGPPPPDILIKGILSIDGDTLKLCFTRDGDRPTEFKADTEKHVILITLKRVKEK